MFRFLEMVIVDARVLNKKIKVLPDRSVDWSLEEIGKLHNVRSVKKLSLRKSGHPPQLLEMLVP
jgi:acetolactate synthase regulatory subunit